jgi:hypothetical protein
MSAMEDPLFDPWAVGEPVDSSEPASEPVPAPRPPRWRSATPTQGVPVSRPVPAPVEAVRRTGYGDFLRTLIGPRLEVLAQRLETARHRTTIDDRLDRSPPALRFRIRPWQGPFATTLGEEGAVLEVLMTDTSAAEIVGRLWLDPLSTTPSEQSCVDASRLTAEWIDRLLLEFVEKALRQG